MSSLALFVSSCSLWHEQRDETAVEKLSPDTVKLSDQAMKNIQVEKILNGEFDDRLSLMGRISVTEDRTAVVAARVSGRVDSVYVASGETVTQGQALINLFSPDFVIAREEYIQAAQQLKSDGKSSDNVNMENLARKKLSTMGLGDSDINKLVESNNPGSSNGNFNIRSPRSGVILDKKAVVGNLVNVGDILFTLGDLSKVWFTGDIYPEDLPKVHVKQEVVVESIAGEKPTRGLVSFISPSVDPTTRTIKIRALIDNSGKSLRADMYVKGNLTLNKRTALLMPRLSAIRAKEGTICFKKLKDNTFQRIPLEIGAEQDNKVPVLKGLSSGDEVVSEGALLLEGALSTTD